jgi:hypothetical protein
MKGAFAVVAVFLAIIISLFVGTAVVDQFTTSQDTFEDLDTAVPLAETGEFVDLDGDTGRRWQQPAVHCRHD